MRAITTCSPAGISSIFEIVDRNADGTRIANPLRIGARGGGFVVARGVKTQVVVEKSSKDNVLVRLNGHLSREAITSETVVRMILRKAGVHAKVSIHHTIEPPIGCGYGTSAAGSLSAALALCRLLDLDMTYNQIGQFAHAAEIKCRTGLGTVGPLMIGGHVITTKAGAPGFNLIDRIPLESDHVIVTGWFGPLMTRTVLSNEAYRVRVSRFGRRFIDQILENPTPENFMAKCREFAGNIGFMTERLRRLISTMERSGAVGVTQNMLGEAVHALVEREKERRVYEAARRYLPRNQVFSTAIEFQGARQI